MTTKRTKPVSLEELWAYEAEHPAVFASPRALVEARLIAALGQSPRPSRKSVGSRRRRRSGTTA